MVLEQGFSKAEALSIQSLIAGMFYITFTSVSICKRYWEMVKTARSDSPFSCFLGNCPVQREESNSLNAEPTYPRQRHRHLPRALLYRGEGSIPPTSWTETASGPASRLSSSACIRTQKPLMDYSNCHSPFLWATLQDSSTAPTCGKSAGNAARSSIAWWTAQRPSAGFVVCPRRTACNLCREAAHIYKDCPKRIKAYTLVAAKGPATTKPAPTAAPAANKKKEGKRSSAPPLPACAPSPAQVLSPRHPH